MFPLVIDFTRIFLEKPSVVIQKSVPSNQCAVLLYAQDGDRQLTGTGFLIQYLTRSCTNRKN